MNIAEVFDARVREQPNAVAVIDGETVHSYAALDRAVRRIAADLLARGAGPGAIVGLSTRQSALHLAASLAIARIGAASVPLHPAQPAAARAAVCDRLRVRLIAGDRPRRALEGRELLLLDPAVFEPQAAPVPEVPCAPGGARPWRIALTSGTTGAPRGVAASHEGTLRAFWTQAGVPALAPPRRMLLLMDVSIAAGVRPAIRQLLSGMTVILLPGTRPADAFAAIDRCDPDWVQCSPATLQSLVLAAPGGGLRCPGVERFVVVGGAVSPALRRRAVQTIATGLFTRYGSTETGLLAAGSLAAADLPADCAGQLPPWVDAQAVDEEGRPLPDGATGRLRFRSMEVAEGYFEDPQASAERFRDGWFMPGDVGRIGPDRTLYLEGRADDVLNIDGVKVNPLEVEAVLAECAGVLDAAAVAAAPPGGRGFLLALVRAGEGFDEAAALALCRERLGRRAPARLLRVPGLPRNAMGKLMRREIAQRVQARLAEQSAQQSQQSQQSQQASPASTASRPAPT
jgi:acyl-coenzyme A synthetase/AMP-(fatty) acid ligase